MKSFKMSGNISSCGDRAVTDKEACARLQRRESAGRTDSCAWFHTELRQIVVERQRRNRGGFALSPIVNRPTRTSRLATEECGVGNYVAADSMHAGVLNQRYKRFKNGPKVR